ncbi:MAG TPA: SGNH/GDSL hydrolase family protein [Terracidiphilus sp.]|nr:SGNH/GDSL hydrolase family protein [Terracidiphilus sp.]
MERVSRSEFASRRINLRFRNPIHTARLRAGAVSSAIALLLVTCPNLPLVAQKPVSIPEKIEWTWEVRPPSPDLRLPNVLLLGDSITRNYFPQVTKDLAGIANVYLMSSSTSIGDPRLPHQIAEFSAMEKVPFRVVHFNNGMHGWGYTEAEYRSAFPQFLHAVQKLVGRKGTSIWANTTPVRQGVLEGATNARVDERNAIALSSVNGAGIRVDDQHALMAQHRDLYEDDVHFNPAGANLQGDQAASMIRAVLRTATSQ